MKLIQRKIMSQSYKSVRSFKDDNDDKMLPLLYEEYLEFLDAFTLLTDSKNVC